MLPFIQFTELVIGIYFAFVIVWMYMLLVSATKQVFQLKNQAETRLTQWPSLSVLIPMYNEEKIILDTIESLNDLDYPGVLEICIADDGSTDDSFELIRNRYQLEHQTGNLWRSTLINLWLVQKENGGRADALNYALSIANGEFVCATDADTVIDAEGLQTMVKKLHSNSELQAIGGTILLSNKKRRKKDGSVVGMVSNNPLVGTQLVEYIRSFIYGRMGLNKWGDNVLISGAFGLFRRRYIQDLGAWDANALAEDLDMTIQIREAGGKVLFIPDPVAWTEAPSTLKYLGSQRDRWYRGLLQALWKWKGSIFTRQPKDKKMSYWVLPMYWIVEWFGPLVQVLGIVIITVNALFFSFNWPLVFWIAVAAYILVTLTSLWSIFLEQRTFKRYDTRWDTTKLVVFALIEPFWYNFFHVYWRLRGLFKYLLFKDRTWGAMKRVGTKIAMVAFLLILPSTVSGQTWVETSFYTEQPHIERTEYNLTAYTAPFTVNTRYVTYRDLDDTQFSLSMWQLFGDRIGYNFAARVSNDKDILLPNVELDGNLTFVLGPVVLEPGAKYGIFSDDNVLQVDNILYLYLGNWRYDLKYGTVPDMGIHWTGLKVHRDGPWYQFDVFGTIGDELLDFPRLVGESMSMGLNLFFPVDRFRLMLGGMAAQRNDEFYVGTTAGLRINF